MLYTMNDLLNVAQENHFAVPAFNIYSYDMLKSIMEEVTEENAPVILQIHPDEINYLGDEFIPSVKQYAIESSLPVTIHLDHGSSLFDVLRAIKNGYTSVMIDASSESLDENIKITKQVVNIAHQFNVSVEAELGTIGNNRAPEGGQANIIYTDPDDAEKFVKQTGIDTFAVAIGTAHGMYPKNMKPKLNIGLLDELRKKINIPFVLHGGSSNKDKEITTAVEHGVCKVNLSTDLKSAFFKQLKQTLIDDPTLYEPGEIYPASNTAVKEVVKHKLQILNAKNKAHLYH